MIRLPLDRRLTLCNVWLRTKEAMDTGEAQELWVLVDSAVSRENISGLAQSRGYSVKAEHTEDGFRLILSSKAGPHRAAKNRAGGVR